jgi:polyvinyl alcohol dehydrogenase (cytochrome)
MKRLLTAAGVAAAVMTASSSAVAQTGTLWSAAGGDAANTRNASAERRITPANAGGLVAKWSFATQGDISATPAVEKTAGRTWVYAVDWGTGAGGYLHAIDGETGVARWSRKLSTYTGNERSVSRTTPVIAGNNVIIGDQGDVNSDGFSMYGATASVMAIDKNSGDLVWRKVVSDHPFSVITASLVAHGNTAYVGIASLEENAGFIPGYIFSFRGAVVALDVNTGAEVWAAPVKTIDDSSYAVGYTGAAVWGSTPVVDGRRGSLYVTTGNNYTSPAGVGKPDGPPSPAGNRIDSVIALDLKTGNLKWNFRAKAADTWDVARWVYDTFVAGGTDPTLGPDHDFGSGANLFTDSTGRELVGAGEKSGQYWALDPDTGAVVWVTQVGVGGTGGGIEWGSAVDRKRVYVAIANSDSVPNGKGTNGGHWTALDTATGAVLWDRLDPIINTSLGFPRWGHDFGQVTVANGVVFAGSAGGAPIPGIPGSGFPGAFFALDAATGAILWTQPSDGAVMGGAAVVDGTVYWGGGGYSHLANAFGITGTPKLFAFTVNKK